MKKGIHPAYGPVAFRDRSGDLVFVSSSTLAAGSGSGETVDVDGTTYPVIDVDVSTASHPFWTGKGRVLDTEGRVEKFNRRYGTTS
ncbi:type B 50S ribosomal protein L31 [Aeromicrobium fastidiosum]|uniref:50S ribosomal protein L31 n=1 Tax=Aeromicrobium fastidiosum TaxID=52699 RepID=A0A641AKB0_9ACTN|nr:type B 50S ribosomal protein L31 [Aeromicrobium fastidiosum]KAA1373597.1 type B 50S ribosomal protein L31 [Aeromicrobium fastidiosum]MBP2391145.1 large subunit ribosomal protein L31 [Aeromicrobium fastidiosum]